MNIPLKIKITKIMYINKNPLKAQNNGTYMRKAVNIKKDVKYTSFYLQSKKTQVSHP